MVLFQCMGLEYQAIYTLCWEPVRILSSFFKSVGSFAFTVQKHNFFFSPESLRKNLWNYNS